MAASSNSSKTPPRFPTKDRGLPTPKNPPPMPIFPPPSKENHKPR